MDLIEQAANNPDKLNLEGLGYNELTEVKRNIETEISVLSNSFERLRMAGTKYSAAKERLMVFTPEANDKEIMVPLTTSVFIPGTLKNVDKFMFEVGASYYVEDTIPKAKDFYSRKVENIKKNMTFISKIIENKTSQRQELILTLQELVIKVQE